MFAIGSAGMTSLGRLNFGAAQAMSSRYEAFALLLWMASGLIMWWKLPGTGLRAWGWLALISGAISFAVIIATL